MAEKFQLLPLTQPFPCQPPRLPAAASPKVTLPHSYTRF